MEEILSQLEGDNSDNNYVVIDVRGVDEIMMGTGTMSDKVRILPLPQITAMAAFDMDEKSFHQCRRRGRVLFVPSSGNHIRKKRFADCNP